MESKKTGRGGKRSGAGRKPTGKAKTETINIRVPPKLKQKAMEACGGNLTKYIISLIEKDLNN